MEALEIIFSAVGSGLGIDPGKLDAWITATENLIGEKILAHRIGSEPSVTALRKG